MSDNGTLIATALNGITKSLLSMGLLGILMILALSLMGMAMYFRRATLAWAAMVPWVLFGFLSYTSSTFPDTGVWDIFYGAFWMTLGMGLFCMVEALLIKPKPEDAKEDIYVDQDIDSTETYNDRLQRGTRAPQIGRRGYNRRKSS